MAVRQQGRRSCRIGARCAHGPITSAEVHRAGARAEQKACHQKDLSAARENASPKQLVEVKERMCL